MNKSAPASDSYGGGYGGYGKYGSGGYGGYGSSKYGSGSSKYGSSSSSRTLDPEVQRILDEAMRKAREGRKY